MNNVRKNCSFLSCRLPLGVTLKAISLVFCHTGSFLDLRQLLLSSSASSTMAVPLTRLSTQHQRSCTSDRISCRQDRISKQRKIKDRILIMASPAPLTFNIGQREISSERYDRLRKSSPKDTIGCRSSRASLLLAPKLPSSQLPALWQK